MKLDRLLGILVTLLQKDRVTAPYLAEKFEVTRRTISRDIDALCRAGVPVVTRQGGGGGISIAEGYKLDKSVLTVDELCDIVAAVKGIGSVSQTSQYERTLGKFSLRQDAVVSLRESFVIDLSSHYRGSLTDKIQTIKQAIREQRQIAFTYFYEKGESYRRIEPYLIVFQWAAWYVFGYCVERCDWRLFKLTRLWALQLCEQTFVPRVIPPEKRDFSAHLADEDTLVALFDASQKYKLIDTYGPDNFAQTETSALRLEIGYTNRAHIIGWLLSFGDAVTVLEPPDIAREIRCIAENIAKRYE